MKLTKAHLDHISDAVGDEFGWCERDGLDSGSWCWRHTSVWLQGSGRCSTAQDVFRAAETAVEYVLSDNALTAAWAPSPWTPYLQEDGLCGCYTCIEERSQAIENPAQRLIFRSRMIVCGECGNKRCPHGTDHRLNCTNSNDPGQEGSNYQ